MWTPPRAGQAAARVDTARRVPWPTYDSQLQPRIDAAARLRTSPPTPSASSARSAFGHRDRPAPTSVHSGARFR